MRLKGKITSYISGIKYTFQEFSVPDYPRFHKKENKEVLSYFSNWIVEVLSNDRSIINLHIQIPFNICGELNEERINKFREVVYNAIIQALFYERIKEDRVIIEIKEEADGILKMKYSWENRGFEYQKDEDFERDLVCRSKFEILKELHKRYRGGLPRDELGELIFFDQEVIADALSQLKEEEDIRIDGNRIFITERGEKTRVSIKDEIESRKSKDRIGF